MNLPSYHYTIGTVHNRTLELFNNIYRRPRKLHKNLLNAKSIEFVVFFPNCTQLKRQLKTTCFRSTIKHIYKYSRK